VRGDGKHLQHYTAVIPANAGIQQNQRILDSGSALRAVRNDGLDGSQKRRFNTNQC
jgi:hypothetical protein